MTKVVSILLAIAVCVYGCFQFTQYFAGACSIGDWSKTTSATVLAFAAASGWLVVACLAIWGLDFFGGKRNLRKVSIWSDKVGARLTSSTTVRIFCSQSASYRGFVHDRVTTLKKGSTIKVLMRTDATAARQDELKKVAAKWHQDIAGRGVTVEVRALAWSPLMFRGWLFDETSAVIGWYNRTKDRTLGQGDDTFLIEDRSMVGGLAATFDAVFKSGTEL